MGKVNAHGGFLVISGAPNVRLDNATHEIDVEEIIDDVTTSGSGGVAEGLACLYKVNSLTTEMPDDSAAAPEMLGLTIGQTVSLYCRRGALAQYDLVANTIFKGLRKSNDNSGKARRLSLTFEYGSYTNNVAPPTGFDGA